MFNSLSYRRLQKIQFNNVKAILQLELKDSYRHLHFIRMNIVDFSIKIYYVLPVSMVCEFFKYLENINNFYFFQHTRKIDKKILWLKEKDFKDKKANIKPISYCCASNNELLNKITSNKVINNITVQNIERIHISVV